MKTRHRLLFLTALCAVWAGARLPAVEPARTDLSTIELLSRYSGGDSIAKSSAQYQSALESLRAEIDRVGKELGTAVSAGTAKEGWSDEARRKMRSQLLFSDRFADMFWKADGPFRFAPTGFIESNQPSFSPDEVFQFPEKSRARRLWPHLLALREFRRSILAAWGPEAADFVETVWLEAREERDLAAASLALSALRDQSGGLWYSSQLDARLPGESPPGLRPESPLADAYIASLLIGPRSFFTPNPGGPAGLYVEQWMASRSLEQWHLSFLERPRIAIRLAEFDREFRTTVLSQIQRVEHKLIADAPAEQLRQELVRLSDLTPKPPTHRLPPPRIAVSNYETLVGCEPTPALLTGYAELRQTADDILMLGWWRFKMLTDARKEQVIDSDEFDERTLARLPQSLRDACAKWQGFAPADSTLVNKTPLEMALTAIVNQGSGPAARAAQNIQISLERLAESAWSGMDSSEEWRLLARQPGAVGLFAARDLEARQILARIVGDPPPTAKGDTLAQSFESALENAFQTDDPGLKKAGRIIHLDEVVAALPVDVRNRYLADWRIFTQLGAQPKETIEGCRRVLDETASPACAALAARRLKVALQLGTSPH